MDPQSLNALPQNLPSPFVVDGQRQPKAPPFVLSLSPRIEGLEIVELPPDIGWKCWEGFIDTERLPLR